MDHRPKGKSYNYKTLRRNMEVNLHDLGLSNGFSEITKKSISKRKRNRYTGFHQN